MPHTHIKLPAWISAANSSLLRQQKRNTVIFIILHVEVSRRQSQNIFGCSLLENLINQLYQLRWEKLGTRSLQYIFHTCVEWHAISSWIAPAFSLHCERMYVRMMHSCISVHEYYPKGVCVFSVRLYHLLWFLFWK